MAAVKVMLVDDDALVRAGLALILGGAPDLEVVAQASDGADAVARAREVRPDVVLMDIRMPIMNGLDATERLMAQPQPPEVVVLTTFDADDHVVRALAAGASGFLLKDTPSEQLIARVQDLGGDDRATKARERLADLTDRERDVALALARGLSNADIARELHLSVPTVKAHISRLFSKLDVTNRVQIAICVHDAGLV